ncbi:MAG: hypothetical protein P4L40_14340 [Terracidiphilus sp.]|nr:hypothetical protein [Terracidiphilus sp.]
MQHDPLTVVCVDAHTHSPEHADRSSDVKESSAALLGIVPDANSLRLRAEVACMMLGLYGVATCVYAPPLLAAFHYGGTEVFVPPPAPETRLIALNAFLDSSYNGLLLFGILLTSPLFMSVGTMLVMPASIVVDRLVRGTVMGGQGIGGAVIIVMGFAMLNVPPLTAARWGHAIRRALGR